MSLVIQRWENELSRKEKLKMFENEPKFWESWKGSVSFNVPMELFRDKGLRPLDREVYMWLNKLSEKRGYSWISNNSLCKLLNVGSNKTIQDSINRLENLGYITKKTWIREGIKKRLIYTKQKIAEEAFNKSLKHRKHIKEFSQEEYEILEYDWIS